MYDIYGMCCGEEITVKELFYENIETALREMGVVEKAFISTFKEILLDYNIDQDDLDFILMKMGFQGQINIIVDVFSILREIRLELNMGQSIYESLEQDIFELINAYEFLLN